MSRTHDANGLPLPRTPKPSPVRDPENERLHAENDALRHELAQTHTHMNRTRDLHASEIERLEAQYAEAVRLKAQWKTIARERKAQAVAARSGMAAALTQAA